MRKNLMNIRAQFCISYFPKRKFVFFEKAPFVSSENQTAIGEETLDQVLTKNNEDLAVETSISQLYTEVLRSAYALREALKPVLEQEVAAETINLGQLQKQVHDYKNKIEALRQKKEIAPVAKEKLNAIFENLQFALYKCKQPVVFGWIAKSLQEEITFLENKVDEETIQSIRKELGISGHDETMVVGVDETQVLSKPNMPADVTAATVSAGTPREILESDLVPDVWVHEVYPPEIAKSVLTIAMRAARAKTSEQRAEILQRGQARLREKGFHLESDGSKFEAAETILLHRQMGKHKFAFEIEIESTSLGSGGQTEKVFRGRDKLTGRIVVLRKLRITPGENFLNTEEARIFEENVCNLPVERSQDNKALGVIPWGIGMRTGTNTPAEVYDVLDMVEGSNMDSYLRNNDVSHSTFFQLALGSVERVLHFHRNGLVARDIKPNNYMVDEEGNVKLIDLQSIVPFEQYQLGLEKGECPFTVSHVPPEYLRLAFRLEQFPQTKQELYQLAQATDVYEVGIVLYEIWSGNLSGASTSVNWSKDVKGRGTEYFVALKKLLQENKNPCPTFEFQENTPEWLRDMITQMCDPDWKRRPSLEEVQTVLLTHESFFAQNNSPLYTKEQRTNTPSPAIAETVALATQTLNISQIPPETLDTDGTFAQAA